MRSSVRLNLIKDCARVLVLLCASLYRGFVVENNTHLRLNHV